MGLGSIPTFDEGTDGEGTIFLGSSDSSVTFDPETVGWWRFGNTLEDSVASADFAADGAFSPSYVSFSQYDLLFDTVLTKQGLKLEPDKTYSATVGASFEGATDIYGAKVGFWYFSPGPVGFTRHVVTRKLTPKVAPLVSKANTTISNGVETANSARAEWIINEIGYSPTQNAIQLTLFDDSNISGMGPTHVYTSVPYLPGFHHIFVTIVTRDVDSSYVRIDIDGDYGIEHVQYNNSSAQATQRLRLQSTTAKLRVNSSAVGYTGHKFIQENGYISDLVAVSRTDLTSKETIHMMRFGAQTVITQSTFFDDFAFYGVGYKQPTTVTTTQILSEGGSILAGRTDGELLRGHRPIWDNEFNYKDPGSVKLLNISEQDDQRVAEWSAGGLVVQGTTIRI